METELENALDAAGKAAQYDERAKRLLGNKIILAHILVKTMDEFRGMDPRDVVAYIETEPLIGIVPVEPGLTNGETAGPRVVGLNTEHTEIREGLVRFDVVFYVRMKDGISQVIVNLEAQKKEPAEYDVLNRAVFYVCRLISSQKERDFVRSNYNDIKRVFSIWVCMNMEENSMDHICLTNKKLLGSHEWKGGLDLLNIVLIGIAKELPEHDEEYELHRLLGILFSMELSANEKIDIMEREYRIAANEEIREEVNVMCNLSEGILERGLEQGMAQGLERGLEQGMTQSTERIVLNMHRNHFTLDQIVLATGKCSEEVLAIIREKSSEL